MLYYEARLELVAYHIADVNLRNNKSVMFYSDRVHLIIGIAKKNNSSMF